VSPKLRGPSAFFAGLLLLVAALALIAVVRRSRQVAVPAPSVAPAPARAPLLGPRAASEPNPTLTFEPQGRKSGSEGSYYVLGMVKNTSPFPVDKPRVVASLRGRASVLATREGYAERDLLAPGESSPVKILMDALPPHAEVVYEVSASRTLYDPGAVPGLKVEQEGEPKQNFGTWEISGTVKNEGKVAAGLIKVELVIRNDAGAMIGLESAYPDTAKLEPGQSARFTANVMVDEKPVKVGLSVSARPAI